MTTEVGKIGSRDWADHKIQNVIPTKTTAVRSNVSTTVPQGIARGVSTLTSMAQPEEKVRYVPLRPVLRDPVVQLHDGELMAMRECLDQAAIVTAEAEMPPQVKRAYLRMIAEMQMQIEEVAGVVLNHVSAQCKLDSKELDEMNLKKTEMVQELCKKNVKTWGALADLMTYLSTATTIIVGSVLAATGVAYVAGCFLVAAGGLGLLNQVANDTKAYPQLAAYFTKSREMQDRIASQVNASVIFATIGMGLYGGIAGNLAAGLNLARGTVTAVDASRKIEMAIGLATAGAHSGKAWKEKEMADMKKLLQLMEGKIATVQQRLKSKMDESKSTISMMQVVTRSARQSVAAAG